jgi:hypothetical protein
VYLPLCETPPDELPPGETPLPPPAVSQRILVVDDNRDAADSLARLLESPEVQVEAAYDGPSALETLTVSKPRIILLVSACLAWTATKRPVVSADIPRGGRSY